MKLRTRMIIIALAAAAGALLVVLFVAGPRLRAQALDTARATLTTEARLMARLVRPGEAGQSPLVWEPVHAEEAAEDVVSSFDALARSRGVELTQRDNGVPRVVSDADRIRRILEVLVDNAIKYTAARHVDGGGEVDLVTGPGNDGGARLEVVDNGPGIDVEHLPRLFERFYRVDKARSRELGGTGLGLSIARHLAEGMGASIAVESELGRGTRFIVDVPARPDPDSGPR